MDGQSEWRILFILPAHRFIHIWAMETWRPDFISYSDDDDDDKTCGVFLLSPDTLRDNHLLELIK